MQRTGTLIIGGGQAGLATSRCLTDLGHDHVVLERGRVAERWRSERWDSLRLLTANWQTRLPGWSYQGHDPEGFMSMPELIGYLEGYAQSFNAPVQDRTTVLGVSRKGDGYCVETDAGMWRARNVVVATGHCDKPHVPSLADDLAPGILQVTPDRYRNPSQLPKGGVLVVGASATGVQLADEIHSSGRPVTLAAGAHTRLPRRYRGIDIMWWLDQMGSLDRTVDQVSDPASATQEPSLQLIGQRRSLDLGALQDSGVRLAGRLTGAAGSSVGFADDLAATTAAADRKLTRMLGRIDEYIETHGLAREVDAPHSPEPVQPRQTITQLDLVDAGISTVLWATGYRRTYPWLNVPVLDERGEVRQHKGVTPSPGLYVMGLQFMHRRSSSFIDGVRHDAEYVTKHIAARYRCSAGR